MEFLLFILIVVIIVGFIVLSYLILRNKGDNNMLEVMRMLQTGSREDRDSLNTRLDKASSVISDLQRSVGEMNEVGRSMKEMQEFLLSPKLRGNVGEQILKELLSQMLPKSSFNLQYAFASGEKVDAAIKTTGGIIPIDSKFPMDNFRKMLSAKNEEEKKFANKVFERDIRSHIDSISKKYILPDEGTIDYALMYVPSEAVYYEVINNQDLYEYAASKRILPVSPTTFYAYLRAILMSFEGQKIEAQAKEILMSLRGIQKDYLKVEENLGTLQKHLTNASNMMTSVVGGFNLLGLKINNAKEIEKKVIDPKQLKP